MMLKLLGLGFIIVFFMLILIFPYFERKGRGFALREIIAYKRLKREIGLAVEGGKRLHITLGHGGLSDIRAGSGLIGLSLLSRIARTASVSDLPPVASTGDSLISILSQDTIKTSYHAIGEENLFEPAQGQLTGLTPFAYSAGTLSILSDENVSVTVFAGHFGAEVGLLTDASRRNQLVALGGSDNLSAQAVMYAAVQEPLVGEELFASGAYLQTGSFHRASVGAQDIMRWVLIVTLLVGVVLKIAGVM